MKNAETFKKLRVIVLCHEDLVPPDSIEDLSAKEIAPFKTEWDVISTLKKKTLLWRFVVVLLRAMMSESCVF